jgi:hypothetical protein
LLIEVTHTIIRLNIPDLSLPLSLHALFGAARKNTGVIIAAFLILQNILPGEGIEKADTKATGRFYNRFWRLF